MTGMALLFYFLVLVFFESLSRGWARFMTSFRSSIVTRV